MATPTGRKIAGYFRAYALEGTAVLDCLGQHSAKVLETHRFTAQGQPGLGCTVPSEVAEQPVSEWDEAPFSEALERVEQAMGRRGLSEAAVAELKLGLDRRAYERPQETVTIAMDDVGVKKQKAQRGSALPPSPENAASASVPVSAEAGSGARGKKRPSVRNTVAQSTHAGQHVTLTGTGVGLVLVFVLAFLLNNRLITQQLRFFTDGERSLQEAMVEFFAWHPAVALMLDGFPLVKKCQEELSLACRGRLIRNHPLQKLLPLLWFGLLDRAQDDLRSIPPDDLKQPHAMTRLIDSLERNRQRIPCYALRRQLGLTNSSNSVERANYRVTSDRQKHKGMSWSRSGSHALTVLNAIVLNGTIQDGVQRKIVKLAFPKAA